MITNTKIFVRNLMRQKSVSLVALGSLSVGIAVALLIGLWVVEEFSFDTFHKNGKQIYRVYTEGRDLKAQHNTFRQLGDNMKDGLPEVKGVCRIVGGELDIEVNRTIFPKEKSLMTEENFFAFFSFPLQSGDVATCLDAPGKMVISRSVARKWFPETHPVGQIVKRDGMDYQITGVMDDIPSNSHIQADIVVPFFGRLALPDCPNNPFSTYLCVTDAGDLGGLEQKITRISDITNSWGKELGIKCKVQSLESIHFSEVYSANQGNKSLVIILAMTALVILLIACVNFINLSIATSFLRVREISVKKTFGAGKRDLVIAFYSETFGYVLLSAGIAVLLALLALPLFNQLAASRLSIAFTSLWLYIYLLGIIVFTFLMAGSYPALYLSRFGIIETLVGKFRGKKLSFLQNSLLVLQFTVSVALLISMFFVNKQVHYMIHYDLGYDKENVVYMEARLPFIKHYNVIRDELLKNPAIKDVTMREGIPTHWANASPVPQPGTQERFSCEICQVKPNYFELMGIELMAGENPFYDTQTEDYIVIDETTVKQFGLKEPIGSVLNVWGYDFIVKGVVHNVNSKSLSKNMIAPMIYLPILEEMEDKCHFNIVCKVTGNPQDALGTMQGQWDRYVANVPFEYEFLDVSYQKLYESEQRLGTMFLCAMLITLVMSVSGLFAIAYYKMQRQIKEVGIRKVNGAGIWDLLVLLNSGFIRLVVIAFVMAVILSYYFASYWLETFSVRTELSWWVFAVAGFIAVAVALFTVSYLTLRTARMNPVEALKSE